ncbi:ATP-binding protein [Candidatus Nitrosoglobus terrae]|uniref:ATP-binding protein n=1 Tax=Candidatus Nitrosoglobus terrae TaxID=1630141 RepID=A0A1Q2SL93_9GAMM|nr:DUF2062 domain-containing protein [Candidatus Nitrosoglobus terrae]BAW79894.1 ATP-binding protein [Candidatus Nitrosoglobus terrae]
MSRRILKRYLPKPQYIKEHKHLRHFGEWLSTPNLWYLNRRSVAWAVSISLFIAFIPVPGHTLLAVIAAIWARVNLPVCISVVWFNNPFTMGPIYFFNYKVGAWLLGSPIEMIEFEATWQWLKTGFLTIWQPFLLGSVVVGLVASILGGLGMNYSWRLGVYRHWKERVRKRIVPQT